MADASAYPGASDGDLRAIVPADSSPDGFLDYLRLLGDAVAAIQQALGIDPQGSFEDVVARLEAGALIVNTDDDPGVTIYVGTIDPEAHDPAFVPVLGDVWLNTTPV